MSLIKQLEYPFDSSYILSKKRKLKRQLPKTIDNLVQNEIEKFILAKKSDCNCN